MVRHLEELGLLLAGWGVAKEDIVIVGGGVLAAKGVRHNTDLDFFFIDEDLRAKHPPQKGEKYVEISDTIDCYTDRYGAYGLTDKSIVEEALYVIHEGYKVVRPEIEVAYKLARGGVPREKFYTERIEDFIFNEPDWDWELFGRVMRNHPATPHHARSFLHIPGLGKLKRALTEPKKALWYLRHIVAMYLDGIPQGVQGQLVQTMSPSALLGNHFAHGEFYRYDVLMRYAAIDAILSGDLEVQRMYSQMQLRRAGYDTLGDFKRLIESIQSKGFKREYPIPVTKDARLIQGAHRLAYALYFDIPEIPVDIYFSDKEGGDYGKRWFIKNGFSESEMALLEDTKRRLFTTQGIYFPVLVWPPAQECFDAIAADIRGRYTVIAEKEILMDPASFDEFVTAVYDIDDIARWKVGFKKSFMRAHEPRVYMMLLEVPHPRFRNKASHNTYLSVEMERLKKSIRNSYKDKITDYFYDTIVHVGDNYEHNKKIIRLIKKYAKVEL